MTPEEKREAIKNIVAKCPEANGVCPGRRGMLELDDYMDCERCAEQALGEQETGSNDHRG